MQLNNKQIITFIVFFLFSLLGCKKQESGGNSGNSNLSVPTVTTENATSITTNSAVLGGAVISDGNSAILERGICYSTTPNPTTSNSKITIGIGTGSFSTLVTNLLPSSLYYVRAYASNVAGLSYGNQQSFSTTIPVPEDSAVSLYIGGGTSLHAINAQTGILKWRKDLGDYVSSSPTYANGKVYIGCKNKLYAFDTTGNQLWTFTTSGDINSQSPVVENGTIYINTGQTRDIYALNATTGTQIWHYDATEPGASSFGTSEVILNNNNLFINSYWLYAFNASTGTLKWKVDRTGTATPAIINNKIYITQTSTNNVDFTLLALDINTGNTLWQKTDNIVFRQVLAHGSNKEKLFVSTATDIYAVDTINASVLWHTSTSSSSFIQAAAGNYPLVAGDDIYSRNDTRINAYNLGTGQFTWQSLGEQVRTNMTIVNNILYYGSEITVTPTTRYYVIAVDLNNRNSFNYKWVSSYAATLPYLISSPCIVTKSGKLHRFGRVFN